MKNRLWTAAAVVFAAWVHTHLVDQAYNTGYEDAEKALGSTAEQCHKWWFGNNKKQQAYELKQFCKRSST
jgi:hypothetical protein